jgi:DNA modification methylase
MSYILYPGNCLDAMKRMEDNSVDSIVTDPPYGLSFMGKKWDYDVPSVEIWAECLRVLKPGGHLLAFAGTRTQHRMAVRIEDAGFEIRDMIFWCYGQGFPKSKNLGDGFGSALKPATEPITLARKPVDGTLEASYAKHGTGGLNIDGCRVGTEERLSRPFNEANNKTFGKYERFGNPIEPDGRWPANLIHDGSDEVVGLFPDGGAHGGKGKFVQHSWGEREPTEQNIEASKGSAARFFYCAKSSKRDRDEGLEAWPEQQSSVGDNRAGGDFNERLGKTPGVRRNVHPTVKPTDLMRYLCRLVTPPGGVVLDPFMGSGSTGKAAMLEGFQFIGCELSPEYMEIARARIDAATTSKQPHTPDLFGDKA